MTVSKKMTKREMEFSKDRLEYEIKELKEALKDYEYDAEVRRHRFNVYLTIALCLGMLTGFAIASV